MFNSNNTPADWIFSVNVQPIMKSLTIDSDEQFVYFGIYKNPLDVWRLSADTGSVVSAQSL